VLGGFSMTPRPILSLSFVLTLGACQGTPEKVSLGSFSATGRLCGVDAQPGEPNRAGSTIDVTIPYTDWTWPSPFNSLEWDLVVESESRQDGYMWNHQFAFTGGAVGFLGLQARGGYQADPPDGPIELTNMVVFWVSSSPRRAELGDVPYPDARTALQLDRGLEWWTIHVKYPFKACRPYHLTVALESTDASGDLWYGAWIRDPASAAQTFLGRILVPAAWGPLRPSTSMWTNRIGYSKLASCESAEPASAAFGFPTANGGALVPTAQTNRFASVLACGSSRFTALPGAVRQEMAFESP